MKLKLTIALLTIGLLALPAAAGDTAAEDAKAIKATVENYLGGWFSSDPERLAKALHPNLSKLTVKTIQGSGLEYLDSISAESLTAFAGNNQDWVKDKKYREIKIVYQDDRIAVVHAMSDPFYDVCGLIKLNGEWKLIHVLWAMNEEEGK